MKRTSKSMKRISKTWAVVLAFMLLLATFPATAFAGEETGTIPGDSTVNDVVINVTVPAKLDFALDPLELDAITGSQVSTADYFFVNKTEAPVKVSMDITATLASGVSLVADKSTLKKDDPSVTDKNLYFAALGAKTIDPKDLDFAFDFADHDGEDAPVGTYDSAASTLIPFSVADKKATIQFALDKATDGDADETVDTLAAANKGVAAFQFYGELNTYAAWAASDVKVTGAYTLTALRATTYANYTTDDAFLSDGVNQLKPNASATIGFTDLTGEGVTVTNSKPYTFSKAAAADITVPFEFGGKTIDSITGPDSNPVDPANYTTDASNIVIKKEAFAAIGAGSKVFAVKLVDDTNTYNVNVTLSYGASGFIVSNAIQAPSATDPVLNLGTKTKTNATDLVVPFNRESGVTVSDLYINKSTSPTARISGTDYVVNANDITFKANLIGSFGSIGPKLVEIHLSDGAVMFATFTVS